MAKILHWLASSVTHREFRKGHCCPKFTNSLDNTSKLSKYLETGVNGLLNWKLGALRPNHYIPAPLISWDESKFVVRRQFRCRNIRRGGI